MSQFFTFKGNDGRLDFLGYYLFSIIIMGVGVWAIELAGRSESMTVMQGLLVLGFIVTGIWVALARLAANPLDARSVSGAFYFDADLFVSAFCPGP